MAANVFQIAQQKHPQAVCAGLNRNPALLQSLSSALSFNATALFSASVVSHVNRVCSVTSGAIAERKVLFERLTTGVYLAALRRTHLWDWYNRYCTSTGREQS